MDNKLDGMTTEQLREAIRAYQQGPVTPPPTSAAEHAARKQMDAIMAKPAGRLSSEERETLRKGIDDWRKTQ